MDHQALERLDARLRAIRFAPRATLETRVLLRARGLRDGAPRPAPRLGDWVTLMAALLALTAFLYLLWSSLLPAV